MIFSMPFHHETFFPTAINLGHPNRGPQGVAQFSKACDLSSFYRAIKKQRGYQALSWFIMV